MKLSRKFKTDFILTTPSCHWIINSWFNLQSLVFLFLPVLLSTPLFLMPLCSHFLFSVLLLFRHIFFLSFFTIIIILISTNCIIFLLFSFFTSFSKHYLLSFFFFDTPSLVNPLSYLSSSSSSFSSPYYHYSYLSFPSYFH